MTMTPMWRIPGYRPLSVAIEAVGRAEQLIDGWLPATGVTAWRARRGGGKTLVALSQAFAFATDRDWFGKRTARGFWSVYACGEDQENTLGNMHALYLHHGVSADDPSVRFLFLPDVPDLTNDDECSAFIGYVRSLLPPDARAVPFIDTWQKATCRVDMNDNSIMHTAMRNAGRIGEAFGGPCVTPVHPPKSNNSTIAGSSVIENDTNAIGVISRPGGSPTKLMLRMERMKGPGEGGKLYAALEERDLGGLNKIGRPYCGAFVAPRTRDGVDKIDEGDDDALFDDVQPPANDDRDGDDHAAVEVEALRLLAAGKSYREVADATGLSKSAVGRLAKHPKPAA